MDQEEWALFFPRHPHLTECVVNLDLVDYESDLPKIYTLLQSLPVRMRRIRCIIAAMATEFWGGFEALLGFVLEERPELQIDLAVAEWWGDDDEPEPDLSPHLRSHVCLDGPSLQDAWPCASKRQQ